MYYTIIQEQFIQVSDYQPNTQLYIKMQGNFNAIHSTKTLIIRQCIDQPNEKKDKNNGSKNCQRKYSNIKTKLI